MSRHTARLVIHNIPELTTDERHIVADWLIKQAEFIRFEGKDCAKKYTAKIFLSAPKPYGERPEDTEVPF